MLSSQRPTKKRKSPNDSAPSESSSSNHAAAAAEDHSSEIGLLNSQRTNEKETDFLSFINTISKSVKVLSDHFICPVCLDFLSESHVAPECLHYFCGECIKESLHRCNNECPACRTRISTRRSLRKDTRFDYIVNEFRDLTTLIEDKVKEMEERAIQESSRKSQLPTNNTTNTNISSQTIRNSDPTTTVESTTNSIPRGDNDHGSDSSDSSVCFLGTRNAPIRQRQQQQRRIVRRPVNPPPTITELINLDSFSSNDESASEEQSSSDDEEWNCSKKSHSKKSNSSPWSVGGKSQSRQPKKKRFKKSSKGNANPRADVQETSERPNECQVGSTADDTSRNVKSLTVCKKKSPIQSKPVQHCMNNVASKASDDSSDDSDSSFYEILNISPFQKQYKSESIGKGTPKDEDDEFCNYKSELDEEQDKDEGGQEKEEEEDDQKKDKDEDDQEHEEEEDDQEQVEEEDGQEKEEEEDDQEDDDDDDDEEICQSSPTETSLKEELEGKETWSTAVTGNNAATTEHLEICKTEPEKSVFRDLNAIVAQRPSRQRQATQRYGNMLSDCQLDAYLSSWKM